MNWKIKVTAAFSVIMVIALFASGCIDQTQGGNSLGITTTTLTETSVNDSDILEDVDQSWSSENDTVEIGEMV